MQACVDDAEIASEQGIVDGVKEATSTSVMGKEVQDDGESKRIASVDHDGESCKKHEERCFYVVTVLSISNKADNRSPKLELKQELAK